MSWKKLREFILHISLVLFALGIYMTVSGGYWVLQRSGLFGKVYTLEHLTSSLGEWNWWILVGGIILVIAGGWYSVDTIRKRREFEEYMESESKREFIKNLRELEELAYKLGEKYQKQLEEKKKEWKIKRR